MEAPTSPQPAASSMPATLCRAAFRAKAGVLRVNAKLIEAQRGLQIWTTAFEYRPETARPAVSHLASRLVWMAIVAESRLALPPRPQAGHYAILGRAIRGQDVDPKANGEAIAHYERSLALNPNWMPTLIIYPWAHLALIDSGLVPPGEAAARLHRVEEVIDRAIRLQPTHLTLLSHRGKLLRLRGDADGAIAQLTNVQAMGQNIVALAELGRAKIDAGRAHEALAHIERAIRTIPDFGAVHLWRLWAGQAALLLGDHEAAVQWFQTARQTSFPYTDPVPWLAVAYAGIGREAEARALLAEHAAKTPGFTVSEWTAKHSPRNADAAAQFARIAETMSRLAAPGGKVEVGQK
jgi:adenylate cyclase